MIHTTVALQEAAEKTNLLAPNAGLMFWTLIVFGIVYVIIRVFFYAPMTAMVQGYEKQLRDALEAAKRDRADSERVLAEHKAMLEAARGEAQKIINDGRAISEKMRTQSLEDTKKQQDELLARAKRDIESEKTNAIAELRREAIDLAITGASRVIGKNLDDATNRKLVEEFLGSVGKA